MRDARAQGRQERGTRSPHDRRERSGGLIDLAVVGDAALRLAGATILEASAFVVWNVGRRSPAALARDTVRAVRDVRAFFAFAVSFAIGIIFIIAAAVLVRPAVANPAIDFAGVMTVTLVVALALEFLIGDDVRALVRS